MAITALADETTGQRNDYAIGGDGKKIAYESTALHDTSGEDPHR